MDQYTNIYRVSVSGLPLGKFRSPASCHGAGRQLEHWELSAGNQDDIKVLENVGTYMQTQDTPVAFPTETVYGLGADATRSAPCKGIFAAKGRPSDNPLIIHVCDLHMLRQYLRAADDGEQTTEAEIPGIYEPLIQRFWPGPLTILLPNPQPSKLAPEVTAGQSSFGVRMPNSPFALSLIKCVGKPLAAPSANASGKPSPTTADHVKHDLDGRIQVIVDAGPCDVGVESTVVDGLCDPPLVLRPGGISMQQLRRCPGWENVAKGYKDESEEGSKTAPRAPGMKYKHYSPKARVVLYESRFPEGKDGVLSSDRQTETAEPSGASPAVNGNAQAAIGIIRTRRWEQGAGFKCGEFAPSAPLSRPSSLRDGRDLDDPLRKKAYQTLEANLEAESGESAARVYDIDLGDDTKRIAQGLFSALRELDLRGAKTIYIDGIEDDMDIAEAVMNRLRKAASVIRA